MSCDYRSKDDLRRLRADLDANMLEHQRAFVLAFCIADGLLVFQQKGFDDGERRTLDTIGLGHLASDAGRGTELTTVIAALIAQPGGLAHTLDGLKAWAEDKAPVRGRWAHETPGVAQLVSLLVAKGTAHSATLAFIAVTLAGQPGGVDDFWRFGMDWMTEGKDAYDPASAGGWCAQELERFQAFCAIAGWTPAQPAPETTAALRRH